MVTLSSILINVARCSFYLLKWGARSVLNEYFTYDHTCLISSLFEKSSFILGIIRVSILLNFSLCLYETVTQQKMTQHNAIYIKAIYSKSCKLENKVIFSEICNWIIIFWALHSDWESFFNPPNFQYKQSNHEMVIRILHIFANKSIYIIMDRFYNGNPLASRFVSSSPSSRHANHTDSFDILSLFVPISHRSWQVL